MLMTTRPTRAPVLTRTVFAGLVSGITAPIVASTGILRIPTTVPPLPAFIAAAPVPRGPADTLLALLIRKISHAFPPSSFFFACWISRLTTFCWTIESTFVTTQ